MSWFIKGGFSCLYSWNSLQSELKNLSLCHDNPQCSPLIWRADEWDFCSHSQVENRKTGSTIVTARIYVHEWQSIRKSIRGWLQRDTFRVSRCPTLCATALQHMAKYKSLFSIHWLWRKYAVIMGQVQLNLPHPFAVTLNLNKVTCYTDFSGMWWELPQIRNAAK